MRPRTHIFIFVFLTIQLILPLRGFVRDDLDSRSDFSWNMYSKRYSCRVRYLIRFDGGGTDHIDHKRYFKRPQKAMKLMHRDSLPYFHKWLCAELERERRRGTLEGDVSCRINDGEPIPLVEPGTSICNTEYYGVLQQ